MTPINPSEQQTQSYNFGATGEVIARERINPVAKAKVSGLFKLLLILLIPVGVLAAAAWFFVGRADDREYELANNVVLIVPMTSVNWQDLGVVFEPIMKLEVVTPEKFMGDVTGSINAKRGQIDSLGERGQARVVVAKVPLSELFGYTTQLRSLTEGRAVPNLEFSHYAVVPRNVQDDIIASRK